MRVPGYRWRPVVGLANDPSIVPHLVILHTDAGNATSLYDWFNGPSNGIEAHLFIPKSKANPSEQYRDTTREADANYGANSWIAGDGSRAGAISIETQGHGGDPWTDWQLAEIKRTLKALHVEHGIPWQVAGKPHGSGIGYHTLFPSWSNVPGKTCPGPLRIAQFHDVLVPWIRAQRTDTTTVRKGDTWGTIAKRAGLTREQLLMLNTKKPDPGTKVRIR